MFIYHVQNLWKNSVYYGMIGADPGTRTRVGPLVGSGLGGQCRSYDCRHILEFKKKSLSALHEQQTRRIKATRGISSRNRNVFSEKFPIRFQENIFISGRSFPKLRNCRKIGRERTCTSSW